MRSTKSFPITVKAADDSAGTGEFTALVSVFGNVDQVGDVVMPGAFTKTLARWAESGDSIPVIWSHDHLDPFSHVGAVTEAVETADGLQITATLDRAGNPKAEQVYRLLKGRRVREFSFAYDVRDSRPSERDGRKVLELLELDVFEVGPTLIGANRETELLAVKADLWNEPPPRPPITPAQLGAWAALTSMQSESGERQ